MEKVPTLELGFEVGDVVTSVENPVLYQVMEIIGDKVTIKCMQPGKSYANHVLTREKAVLLLRKVWQYVVCSTNVTYDDQGEVIVAYHELITPAVLLKLASMALGSFTLRHVRADKVDVVNHDGRAIVQSKGALLIHSSS